MGTAWGHEGTWGDVWGQRGDMGDMGGRLGTRGGRLGTWGGRLGTVWGHGGTWGDTGGMFGDTGSVAWEHEDMKEDTLKWPWDNQRCTQVGEGLQDANCLNPPPPKRHPVDF